MSDYKVPITTADSGTLTVSSDDVWTTANLGTACESIVSIPSVWTEPKEWTYTPARQGIIINKKGGDDDMRYLYEVILVNPKNDTYFKDTVVAKSETSALMKVYDKSKEYFGKVDFDDLKTSYKILMEWKKEKSLKKAIETIKEAVE